MSQTCANPSNPYLGSVKASGSNYAEQTVARSPELTREASFLGAAVDDLHKSLDELHARLAPICAAPSAAGSPIADNEPAACELGGNIAASRRLVNALSTGVRNLIDRLEI